MNLLSGILNLLGVFCDGDFLSIWFFPLIAIAFLASLPGIIRALTTWR